ncbi:MAG: iron-containing alcohol dehydrogenase [Promethearchaeota archaeon]
MAIQFGKAYYSQVVSFDNPPRILFGWGAIDRLAEEASSLGSKEPLLVTDENIERTQSFASVKASLKKLDVDIEEYVLEVGEPTIDKAQIAVNHAREKEYDLVVGVGGGSVLDVSKLIAALICNPGDVEPYIDPMTDRFSKGSIPKILIPTTSGTGSEVSPLSVVVRGGLKDLAISKSLLADVALLDPELTISCPPSVTASSGMDSLAHLLEGLMGRESMPISDAIGFEGTILATNALVKAFEEPTNKEARIDMALASLMGGWMMCFPWAAALTIGHCIAETVGPKYGIPHGTICATVLPYVVVYNAEEIPKRIKRIAHAMAVETTEDAHENGRRVAEKLLSMMERMNVPTTLELLGVPHEDLNKLAKLIVDERQQDYDLETFNPKKLTYDNVKELMKNMGDGHL